MTRWVDGLVGDTHNLQIQVTRLETTVGDLDENTKELAARVGQMDVSVAELKGDMKSRRDWNETIKTNLSEVKALIQGLKKECPGHAVPSVTVAGLAQPLQVIPQGILLQLQSAGQ